MRSGNQRKQEMSRSYEDTIAHIKYHKGTAFAFIPKQRDPLAKSGPGLETVGGDIFIIAYCEEHEDDPAIYPVFYVYHTSGLFNSTRGEQRTYRPAHVPAPAKNASYQMTEFDLGYLNSELEFVLQELRKHAIN